jgi:hypothetical protein
MASASGTHEISANVSKKVSIALKRLRTKPS